MLDPRDRQLMVATQGGLPLVTRPYQALGQQLGISEQDVKERLQRMLDCGIIRRIGAVPNHYRLGYLANGMTVWDVADEQVDELGLAVGRLSFVSHCYRRPRYLPSWPYNLFAMVHGRDRQEVAGYWLTLRALLGKACRASEVLYSSRILKKTGLRLGE